MSIIRKYVDKLLVDKNELTEKDSKHAALLSSLLKIREQQWSIPNFDRNEIEMMVEFICTAWSRLSMMYSLQQMSWFFIFLLCQYLCVCYFEWNQCVRLNWWIEYVSYRITRQARYTFEAILQAPIRVWLA